MHFTAQEVYTVNTFSGVFPLMCIRLSFLLLPLFCSVQGQYSLASGSDVSFCVYPLCVGNSAMHQCYLKTHSYTHFLSLFLTDKQTQSNTDTAGSTSIFSGFTHNNASISVCEYENETCNFILFHLKKTQAKNVNAFS